MTAPASTSSPPAVTPIPIHELDEALGLRRTRLPRLVLLGGILGGSAGFSLEYWASTIAYPMNIGGRPFNSWPQFIPVTFETTVLGAALTWAIGTVLQKKFPVSAPPAAYTAWMMLIGGVPIYLAALAFDSFRALGEVSLWPALAVAYNVLFSFAWAHWAWIKLATSVSVTTFSLAMLMTPVVGVFSGMLFLGERPGWLEFGALGLVLASLATVVVPVRKP